MELPKISNFANLALCLMVVALLASLTSCSLFSGEPDLSIELQEPMSYTIGQNAAREGKAGEILALDTEAVLLEAPAKVSMFVIPSPDAQGKYTVSLKNTEDISRSIIDKRALEISNKAIAEVIEIQLQLASKRYDRALTLIEDLEGKISGLEYLNFLKASAYLLKGNKDEAKKALSRALEFYPNDEKGKRLEKILNK